MTDAAVAAAQEAVRALKGRIQSLDDNGLDLIFREARTFNGWQDRDVPDDLLRTLFDVAKMGPTAANGSPMRLVFVKSKEGKERLKPALAGGNLDKTMAAPVCAIVGYDLAFWEKYPFLFPHRDMSGPFKDNPQAAETASFRNGSLQGAYLMVAARALGLDCGPMSGFDQGKVDAEFFSGTEIKSNFLCNLGYGEPDSVFQRLPRFDFDDACSIV
ncbi:MAG: malonic semialdehyde reductase [Alphaproteobacteria bacterium]|nr:malonic semialdehyde reductase [Alphaproteobacteria bacterium]